MKSKRVAVQHIDPFSTAKAGAVVFPVCGSIGLTVLYINFLVVYFTTTYPIAPDGAGFGHEQILTPWNEINFFNLLLGFILLGIAGYFIGFVGAFVYNGMGRFTGGVKLWIREIED